MALIKGDRIQPEQQDWQLLDDESPVPEQGGIVVSLGRWKKDVDTLRVRSGQVAVQLEPHDDALELEGKLEGLASIYIAFPKFTDGRGYSSARLLRERLNYRGELRAVGDILADQLFYMRRVGFDAFELNEGKSVDNALAQLKAFSVTYQGAADDDRPLFRRLSRPS